jgi:NADH:ubiquinone reductase (H+-translocating)
MNTREKKKIVILGGGFGGLYTYLSLRKQYKKEEVDITIVNRTNYFLFTPLLHEVATGSISQYQVVESIRQIIYKSKTHLHIAELLSVDHERRIVKTSIAEIPYDVLVVALGATTNFYDTPGAQENGFVLKDLRDAVNLRTALIDSFEKASEIKDADSRKKILSFAIIGGGATGVELVAEAADLFLSTFAKYYKGLIKPSDITLTIINKAPDLLSAFHPRLRKSALRVLQNDGVHVLLNTGVKEVRKNGIVLDNGTFLETNIVVWTAGVKPNSGICNQAIEKDPGGRIIVTNTLQVPNRPEIFVLGDMASVKGKDGRPLPMLAQVAVRQGKLTGKNIKHLLQGEPLNAFKYKSQGELASLGQWHAVANIGGIKFRGAFAWFLWRTIYLFKFLSASKKIKIAVDWTINIFYPRDITKA